MRVLEVDEWSCQPGGVVVKALAVAHVLASHPMKALVLGQKAAMPEALGV